MRSSIRGESITRREMIARVAAGALVGMAAPAVAARSAMAAPSGTLRVAYGGMGTNRHPYFSTAFTDSAINHLLFDPLLRVSPQGALEPILVANYVQVSETRWRLSLHRNATFADRTPVTAMDAKFSVETMATLPGSSIAYYYTPWLEGVELVDNYTVDLLAKKPTRLAMVNIALYSLVIPRSATDPKAFAQRPIGSGPYTLREFVPNDRAVLVANPAYWGSSKPAFQQVIFRPIPEPGTRLAALETGEVDFATEISPDAIRRLEAAGLKVSSVPSNRTMFVSFNLAVKGPWQDVRVRRALNHAVDRDAVRKALLGGLGANARTPVTSGTRFSHKDLPDYTYDPAKAKQLLTAAGYPQGFSARMVTPNGRYLKDREMAEAVAGQLEAVGVKVTVVPLEWATYDQQMRLERETSGKQYDMFLMALGNVSGDPDYHFANAFERKAPYNFGGYENAEVQKSIEQGRVTYDEAKLEALYKRAQELVWEDAPWIFLVELPVTVAHSPKFAGYVPRPDEQIRWHTIRRVE